MRSLIRAGLIVSVLLITLAALPGCSQDEEKGISKAVSGPALIYFTAPG